MNQTEQNVQNVPTIVFDNFEFMYTNKPITESDVVQIASKFRLYEKFGAMLITDDIYRELKKLPTLVYVDNVDDSSPDKQVFINVKTSKTAKVIKQAFPAQLFKPVKVPKIFDIISWLCDGNISIHFPSSWVFFKNELTTISTYLLRIFYNYPRLLREADRLLNDMFIQHSYQDILIYYKTVIQKHKLRSNMLYTTFNGKTPRVEFIDICTNFDKWWTEADAKGLYVLNNQKRTFERDGIKFLSNKDRVDFFKNPKLAVLNAKQNKESFEQEVQRFDEMLLTIHKNKIKNDKRFIEEVNQDIIDELQLTLFNTCTLKKLNSILYTFIDKNNNKVFHIAPFEYQFFVSYKNQIIENDYIVKRDENVHTKYAVSSYQDLQSIKYQLNSNYDRFMKMGGK